MWGTIFFYIALIVFFLKTSYKTEMPLSNKINTTVIHDMISNKNLKCEGKKKTPTDFKYLQIAWALHELSITYLPLPVHPGL